MSQVKVTGRGETADGILLNQGAVSALVMAFMTGLDICEREAQDKVSFLLLGLPQVTLFPVLEDGIRDTMAKSALQGAFDRLATQEPAPANITEALGQAVGDMMSADSPEYGRLISRALEMLHETPNLLVSFMEGTGWAPKDMEVAKAFVERVATSVARNVEAHGLGENWPPVQMAIDTFSDAGGRLRGYVPIGREVFTAHPDKPGEWSEEEAPLV